MYAVGVMEVLYIMQCGVGSEMGDRCNARGVGLNLERNKAKYINILDDLRHE